MKTIIPPKLSPPIKRKDKTLFFTDADGREHKIQDVEDYVNAIHAKYNEMTICAECEKKGQLIQSLRLTEEEQSKKVATLMEKIESGSSSNERLQERLKESLRTNKELVTKEEHWFNQYTKITTAFDDLRTREGRWVNAAIILGIACLIEACFLFALYHR